MENTMISYDPSNGERLGQVRARLPKPGKYLDWTSG
jgi:hypothetical protein